jgi:hypothetical protein
MQLFSLFLASLHDTMCPRNQPSCAITCHTPLQLAFTAVGGGWLWVLQVLRAPRPPPLPPCCASAAVNKACQLAQCSCSLLASLHDTMCSRHQPSCATAAITCHSPLQLAFTAAGAGHAGFAPTPSSSSCCASTVCCQQGVSVSAVQLAVHSWQACMIQCAHATSPRVPLPLRALLAFICAAR